MFGLDTEYVPDGAGGNRILSYQLFAIVGDQTFETIVYPPPGKRLSLQELLGAFIQEAIGQGYLKRWPKELILAVHWTRADLPSFSDFRKLKAGFDSVRRTYATSTMPLKIRLLRSGHLREISVTLLDTMLLTPGKSSSLEAVGKLYGIEKLMLGETTVTDSAGGPPKRIKYIERMDLLLADDPELFRRYAMRDAEISARHAVAMVEFVQKELGARKPLPTLAAIAVQYVLAVWKNLKIDPGSVLGYEIVRERVFDDRRGRYKSVARKRPLPLYDLHRRLAVAAFHGGRNECFHIGPTAVGEWFEYDLVGAYSTMLAAIRLPDYDRAFVTTDPGKFTVGTLGFALVHFRFRPSTRHPSLPVRAPHGHGLIYTLEGETTVTATEIAVAISMGAHIEIVHGVIIPWKPGDCRPFEPIIQNVQRNRAMHEKGSLLNELWKEIGNSIYGKLGQGLRGRDVFSSRTGQRERIPPCQITCPYLAACRSACNVDPLSGGIGVQF